jgi:hypothetical protein
MTDCPLSDYAMVAVGGRHFPCLVVSESIYEL